jgi:hypothetical protein
MNKNKIIIDKLILESGCDLYINEIKEYMVQPTIKQISYVMQGEQQFLTILSTICTTIVDIEELSQNNDISQEELNLLAKISSFEYLIGLVSQKPYIFLYLVQLFKLFFPNHILELNSEDEDINIKMIHKKDKDKYFIIDKNNYETIIFYIEQICNLHFDKHKNEYNPINEKARQIAEKLQQSKEKLQKLKKDNGAEYFYANLINLLRGTGNFDMNDLMNMTIYQLIQTYQRFMLYDGRHIQTIYHAAGADIELID